MQTKISASKKGSHTIKIGISNSNKDTYCPFTPVHRLQIDAGSLQTEVRMGGLFSIFVVVSCTKKVWLVVPRFKYNYKVINH